MYILQFCNTFTQDIIREETYKEPTMIKKIINGFTQATPLEIEKTETFLVDKQLRIFKADYITYKIYHDGEDIICKLFFRVQSAEYKMKR